MNRQRFFTLLAAGMLIFCGVTFGISDASAHPHTEGKWWSRFYQPRVFLGVQVLSITEELREFFGADEDAGVLVASLDPEGPGQRGGIRVGDVIVAVDEQAVCTPVELVNIVGAHEPGGEVEIELVREHRRETIKVTLGERERRLPQFDFRFRRPHRLERGDDLFEQLERMEKRLERLEKDRRI